MHHTPSLLPGLPHLVENRKASFAADYKPQQRHQNKGASAANPRAAVHNWNGTILD